MSDTPKTLSPLDQWNLDHPQTDLQRAFDATDLVVGEAFTLRAHAARARLLEHLLELFPSEEDVSISWDAHSLQADVLLGSGRSVDWDIVEEFEGGGGELNYLVECLDLGRGDLAEFSLRGEA